MDFEELLLNEFWGIVTYTIVGDCLNGLWTNNDPMKSGLIMNEIARKIPEGRFGITGKYNVSWIDANAEPTFGTLEIDEQNGLCTFSWSIDQSEVFRGRGFRLTQIDLLFFIGNATIFKYQCSTKKLVM
jgi:hypothetical protein